MVEVRQIRKVALCASRHIMPLDVKGSVFPKVVDLDNISYVEDVADKFVCQCKLDNVELHLYCSGAQIPILAVVNACIRRGVPMVAYHYNPTTGLYVPQKLYINEEV